MLDNLRGRLLQIAIYILCTEVQFYAKAIFFMDWLCPAGEGFKSMG